MAEYKFEAEVSQVLSLVINSLYSNKEIFLRELVSNASDAIDKARFRAISEKDLLGEDTSFRIRVLPDEEAGTLTINDNGVGMTKEELIENLGTIAHSGSRAFVDQLKAAANADTDVDLIGQFGVGFYSAFLVADKVEVITRAANSEQAYRWTSDAGDGYTIDDATLDHRGTSVVLHLKEEQLKYLQPWSIRELVSRYADYVSHAIEMPVQADAPEEGEEDAPQETTYEQINKASALWRRSESEITDDQYNEFYKHLTHDWQDPLARAHFKVEGTQLFTGLLFVPGQPPFDMFTPDSKHGIRLYVKRVFIMEDCKELLPQWLRFVRGVVDSDDLPLNVSRELLQDSRTVKTIEKQVVKKALAMLEKFAKDSEEDYLKFWDMFGRVLKEGLHFAPEHAKKLGKLVRYQSSAGKEWTSLTDYVSRMPEDQTVIYYAQGPSLKLLESSPHLEGLKKRGFEILYMVDGIDEWAMQGLKEFDEKRLVSALSEDLELGDEEQDEEAKQEQIEDMKTLTERFTSVLDARVQEVRVSERLEDSPVCLVVPEGGMNAHIERMLRAQDQEVPHTKRILEVNPKHALIQSLKGLAEKDGDTSTVSEWIELLYDQALIAEGSPLDDPALFAKRVTSLMESAIS